MPAPANDNFASAEVIPAAGGAVTFTGVGASWETGEPGYGSSYPTVWFSWTPTTSEWWLLRFDQPVSGPHYQLRVFTGTSLSDLVGVTGYDGFWGDPSAPLHTTSGTTYWIQVGTDGAPVLAGGTLHVDPFTPAAGDMIDDPLPLSTMSGTLAFDNTAATIQANERPVGHSATMWFEITPDFTGYLGADTLSSPSPDIYGSMHAWDTADLSLPAPPTYDTPHTLFGGSQTILFGVTAGHTYLIRVGAYDTHADNVLSWGRVYPPDNDAYSGALVLEPSSGGTVAFDSTVSTSQAADDEWDYTGSGTLWYSYTSPVTGSVTIDTLATASPTDADTYLAVWVGGATVPTNDDPPLADYDDGGPPEYQSAAVLTFTAEAGVTYMVQLSAYDDITDGVLTWSGPETAEAPPTGVVRSPIRRNSPIMPSLGSLDSRGRPIDWAPSEIIREDWGHLRVFCGTTDVTFFRDVPTEIREYDLQEPFAYGPAVIAFPQISPYDTLGVGTLDWFVHGMNVTIKRENPTTGELTNIWEGLADKWDPEGEDDDSYVFVVNCIGALAQSQFEPMPPAFEDGLVDGGAAIKQALDGVPSRRYAALPTVVTTRGTRNRGSWQSRYDYVQEILSTLYNADGTRQWTVGCNPGRFPTLHQKDMTTVHWTVCVGAPGVKLMETSDVAGAPNVFFGEGIYEGGRWRNSRYPTSNPPVFVPLAYVSENMPFTYDGEGNPAANPSFDPTRLRVARYENMGDGVSKSEGAASALGELARDVNPGWYGDLILGTDPEEGCAFDMRAGQNIALRHHHGNPTRLFHIARIKVSPPQRRIALTIDTNARDWITLDGLRKRDREAAADPARRLNPPRRRSRMTPDARPVFDAESGAGIIPATSCTGAAWTVIRIPAGRFGTISSTEFFTTSSATRFSVGVFGAEPSTSDLNAYVGNPIADVYAWDTNATYLEDTMRVLEAWGDGMGLGGYWPKAEADDPTPPITGVHKDRGGWDYISDDPPWLWVAVFPDSTCTFSGRLYLAPET